MTSAQDVKDKNNEELRRIRILYGDEVTVLPLAAADAAERASGIDCKILMCLAADPAVKLGTTEAIAAFANRIGCDTIEVDRAIAYWRGAGVIEYTPAKAESKKKLGRKKKQTPEEIIAEELEKRGASLGTQAEPEPETEQRTASEPAAQKTEMPEKKVRRASVLPNYTTTELADLLEKRKNLSLFLDECQRAYGKMFNPMDINKVLGLVDYLSLSEEYVLTLLRYFGEMPESERKPLHYVERMAFSLYDDGITDLATLSAHLERLNMLKTNEGQIRSIFGMGTRAFSAKEKKEVLLWLGEYGCSMELIRLAYEKTVNATSKPSIPYASKILERWYREGLKTPEEVEASEQSSAVPSEKGNFDTDDFFEAALRRSYGDAYEQIYQNSASDEDSKKD